MLSTKNYTTYGILIDILGYEEQNKNKLGLFSKKIGVNNTILYVDLRKHFGPMCYFNKDSWDKKWEINRLIKIELKQLEKYNIYDGCTIRPLNTPEWESYFIDEDGYCQECKKDFKDNGWYCSSICEDVYNESRWVFCDVCLAPIDDIIVSHHISYFPEEIIDIHPECHAEIHFTWDHPHLRPKKGEADKFYKNL